MRPTLARCASGLPASRLLACCLLACAGTTGVRAAGAPAAVATPAVSRVLVVGNSLSYVNDFPAMLTALSAAQPVGMPRWQAELLAAPGGTIAERWADGVAARELATGRWQALALQERGGTLACLARPERRSEADCQASVSAHRNFAKLAQRHGVRVVLLGTWGPDAIWQAQLGRGLRQLAAMTKAEPLDLGAMARAQDKADPSRPMTTDAIGHPSLDGSLLMALALYRQLGGRAAEPVAFEIRDAPTPTAPVRADVLLSAQPASAGAGLPTRVDPARVRALAPGLAAGR